MSSRGSRRMQQARCTRSRASRPRCRADRLRASSTSASSTGQTSSTVEESLDLGPVARASAGRVKRIAPGCQLAKLLDGELPRARRRQLLFGGLTQPLSKRLALAPGLGLVGDLGGLLHDKVDAGHGVRGTRDSRVSAETSSRLVRATHGAMHPGGVVAGLHRYLTHVSDTCTTLGRGQATRYRAPPASSLPSTNTHAGTTR